MTLTFTPISQLGLITTPESNDTLLLLDASTANQAGRITLEILGSFLANTAAQIDWANILNKPSTFPPVSHTHTKEQITDLSLDWQGITDKPSAFPPASHTHTKEQITDLSLDWQGITDKPSAFPPAVHTHIPADVSGLNGAIDARLNNLPNGAIIGGVAHFFQNSPPAMRNDGSLIQDGDRLYKPNAQDYFFDGVRWLTCQAGGISYSYDFASAPISNSSLLGYEEMDRLWIDKLIIIYKLRTAGTQNSQNYWMPQITFRGEGSQYYYIELNGTAYPLPDSSRRKIIIPINQVNSFLDFAPFVIQMPKVGNPTSVISCAFNLLTRGIHP